MGVSGQLHATATLPPRKSLRYPLNSELSRAVWTTLRSKNSCPHLDSNSEPLVVQPVASRYTDCVILALVKPVPQMNYDLLGYDTV
jgi:hypothetical protein